MLSSIGASHDGLQDRWEVRMSDSGSAGDRSDTETLSLIPVEASDARLSELLHAHDLVTEDLADSPGQFYLAVSGRGVTSDDAPIPPDAIAGGFGLELDQAGRGLVRSLAVVAHHRRRGIGGALMRQIEALAEGHGVRELWLITTTAERFFNRHGYATVDRGSLPPLVAESAQLQLYCAGDAWVMHKALEDGPDDEAAERDRGEPDTVLRVASAAGGAAALAGAAGPRRRRRRGSGDRPPPAERPVAHPDQPASPELPEAQATTPDVPAIEDKPAPAPGDGFVQRWTDGLSWPSRAWADERDCYPDRANPGFISVIASTVFAVLQLLSMHRLLQSLLPRWRYLLTDLYFVAWAGLVLLLAGCAAGAVPAAACMIALSGTTFAVVVYRLVEIISRELWIVLYRRGPLTSPARTLVLAVLNYATIAGLFGVLYNDGPGGFQRALAISFALPADDAVAPTTLSWVQSAYCVVFSAVVISRFIARARPGGGNGAAGRDAEQPDRIG
jgi:amino-acid N-acetyltransferase